MELYNYGYDLKFKWTKLNKKKKINKLYNEIVEIYWMK